mgnify:CR=1 FL=1
MRIHSKIKINKKINKIILNNFINSQNYNLSNECMDDNRFHPSIRENTKIKRIEGVIKDAKRFNQKISDQIKKTDRYLTTPHPPVNKGTIRRMIERDREVERITTLKQHEKKYQDAKTQYNNDLHDLMEKIISMKKKNPC